MVPRKEGKKQDRLFVRLVNGSLQTSASASILDGSLQTAVRVVKLSYCQIRLAAEIVAVSSDCHSPQSLLGGPLAAHLHKICENKYPADEQEETLIIEPFMGGTAPPQMVYEGIT